MIVVHQVNCQGIIESSFAKYVRETYPDCYKAYKIRCSLYRNHNLSRELLGTVQVYHKGIVTVINMFSALLVFVFAINCLINCGIIKFLSIKYQKSGFVLIIIQMFVRPLSNASSFALLTSIYNEYGVDSFYGILSTFIHSTFDTLFYIITIYFSVTKITKYQKVLWYGIIILLFNYFLVFVISFFFKY